MMARGVAIALAGVAAAAATIPAQAQSWTVGTEREVDEGYYFKLAYSAQGWRVWSIETRAGVDCRAIKSAKGRPHPEPLGVAATFFRGTPYIMLATNRGRPIRLTLHGLWGTDEDWRRPGDRFWNESLSWSDIAELDGEQIEVHTATWEYDTILVGLEDERGVIDLAGLDDAVAALRKCDPLTAEAQARIGGAE
jgi:hypothetical protein